MMDVDRDVRVQQIEEYLTDQVRTHGMVGLSAAVLLGDRVMYMAGLGQSNLESGTPATADTLYELASVTKPFTATLIMLLVEEGRLSLDGPVADFFPEAPSSWEAITIRTLLNHSSGIPDYFALEAFQWGGDFAWQLDFSHDEILAVVCGAPLDFAPGTDTAYSNTNYTLLGILIERVTGFSYEDFLAERICRPLGMTATRRNSRTDIIPGRAAGYMRDADVLQNAPYTSMTWAYAEGGIVSSARDMARWDRALTRGEILPQKRLEEMWNPPVEDLPAMGLGWSRNAWGAGITIGHSGGKPGFATYHARLVDLNASIIVLANASGVPIIDLGRGLAGLLAAASS